MSAPVFSTLGCRLNVYETEVMKSLAAAAGLENAVIVNTCAVTSTAVRKARQEIRRLRRRNPDARLFVTGCAAQTEPETFAEMEEVDAVIGNAEKLLPETWKRMGGEFAGIIDRVQVGDIMSVSDTVGHFVDGLGARSRAYVQIQNGCDHRCTFCVIPYGRGNSRSVPAAIVVHQIRHLVERGYREVVLTGVDLTGWGADLPMQPKLGDLVARILRLVPNLMRLRLSSIDSIEVDGRLMQAIATEPRLMPHLHLSLQHGDDLILKRMKRRHSRGDAIRFTENVRRLRPDVAFGADLIAGFPTETDTQFENSLKLVRDCGLTWLHVFPYSPRNGTLATRMPQVDRNSIRERAARLRDAGTQAATRFLANEVGKTRQILLESDRIGRTEQFAEVLVGKPYPKGEIVSVRIASHDGRRLAVS